MPNGTWRRSTAASRRAERQIRYAHVSVNVGVNISEESGMLTATRTPKGKGSTAKRAKPKIVKWCTFPKIKGHDWPGAYPGRLASLEKLRRDRRNARKRARIGEHRKTVYGTKEFFTEALQL